MTYETGQAVIFRRVHRPSLDNYGIGYIYEMDERIAQSATVDRVVTTPAGKPGIWLKFADGVSFCVSVECLEITENPSLDKFFEL